MEGTTFTQRYPRSTLGSVWRMVLALLSFLLVFLTYFYLYPAYGVGPFELFLVVGFGMSLLTFSARFFPFYRIQNSLVREGSARRRIGSAKEEVRRAIVWFIVVAICTFSPILLIPFLPPVEWFSTVVGAFFGIWCGETIFLVAIRLWEHSNKSDIYRYRVYSFGLRRNVLVEHGLRTSPRQRRKK